MKGGFLDHHSYIHGPVHDLHPYTKFMVSSAIMIAAIIVPSEKFTPFIPLFFFLLFVVCCSKLPPGHMLSKMKIPLVITFLTIVFVPFFKPSEHFVVLLQSPFKVRLYVESTLFALHIICRAFIVLFSVVLLISVMPFRDILKVLQRIRVPDIFLRILSIFYRYLFIFSDEVEKMQKAIKARYLRRNSVLYFKMAANIAGTLFLRSLERGESTYQAMCARGFNGSFTDLPLPEWNRGEAVVAYLVLVLLLSASYLAGRLL